MAIDDPPPAEAASTPHAVQRCWRCGLEYDAALEFCSHCAARNKSSARGSRAPVDPLAQQATVKLLLWSYSILLVTGILHALLLNARLRDLDVIDEATQDMILGQMLCVELIDTVVVVWALCRWQRSPMSIPRSPTVRAVSWLSAIPVLGAMLSINYGYHWLLRQYIDSPLWTEELTEQFGWLSLIVICIQPAIVEEAYCRWFALDALQGVTGRSAAIWISATMFGLFHVAVLPSIPYLILFGVVLACLRLASGSLLLPIVVHLLHNLFILLRG